MEYHTHAHPDGRNDIVECLSNRGGFEHIYESKNILGFQNTRLAAMGNDLLVSIIIPTFNAAHMLKACLESIRRQSHQNVEVVVVDQESTDGTVEMAEPLASRCAHCHDLGFILRRASRGMPAPQDRTGRFCTTWTRHDAVAVVVGRGRRAIRTDPELGALIVHEQDITSGFWSRCKALERRCYWGNDAIESARIVRRDVFEAVGGYDEQISSGEDFDIHRRYKSVGRIGFCENVVTTRSGRIALEKDASQEIRLWQDGWGVFHETRPVWPVATQGTVQLLSGKLSTVHAHANRRHGNDSDESGRVRGRGIGGSPDSIESNEDGDVPVSLVRRSRESHVVNQDQRLTAVDS